MWWLLACIITSDPQDAFCLDQDADGVYLWNEAAACGSDLDAQVQDCDDLDPRRFPGNPEVAYDRIDQDCDDGRLDLVDVDGDGFPGVSRGAWEAQSGPEGDDAPWPDDLPDGTDGTLDCDDVDPDVFPGAADPPDGDDRDCDGAP